MRVRPGLFWAYDESWGWLHLEPGFGGLCRLEQALSEAARARVPFTMVSSSTGLVFFDWRFDAAPPST